MEKQRERERESTVLLYIRVSLGRDVESNTIYILARHKPVKHYKFIFCWVPLNRIDGPIFIQNNLITFPSG